MHRSTFLPLQHTATLIFSVDWGLREGLRQFLHTSLSPMAAIIENELQRKLDPGITLGFTNLMAVDVQGKARSLQSMVNAGVELERAVILSGLLVPE